MYNKHGNVDYKRICIILAIYLSEKIGSNLTQGEDLLTFFSYIAIRSGYLFRIKIVYFEYAKLEGASAWITSVHKLADTKDVFNGNCITACKIVEHDEYHKLFQWPNFFSLSCPTYDH